MASKQPVPCAKYKYVHTPAGAKIVPVLEGASKDEESPAEYNSGGYLPVKVKDTFKDGRYHVLRKLGWGHFSTVWLVKDTQQDRHSALKIVKSAGRYAETARDEIKLLRKVAAGSLTHPGREHVVAFFDAFQHSAGQDTHVCIVCEPLGENLLSLLERNKKKGVPIALVKVITKQALLGLQYLHDECDLIHTDIKPENIMVAIPDVEMHIQLELSMSPSPTCRRVGVPLPAKSRAGVKIRAPAIREGQSRHVDIFDSQPLSSPSPSASVSSSPHVRSGLRMSCMPPGKHVSASSSTSTTPLSVESVVVSVAALSTPPTSIGSAMSKLTISSDSTTVSPEADHAIPDVASADGAPTTIPPTDDEAKPLAAAKPAGPSLLSQTAPPREITPAAEASTVSDPLPGPYTSPDAGSIPLPSLPPPISVKIADLGNATPSKRHYTEDIQTRQYRSPESIMGRSDWSHNTDVWSLACVTFELLTAEYLFDPQGQGELFSKDDDHMAQIMELLGDFPLDAKMGGRYSRELFDSAGALRYIKTLKHWPLDRVMVEKYLFSEKDAKEFCSFMLPMLEADHRKRAQARDLVDHPWLDTSNVNFEDVW